MLSSLTLALALVLQQGPTATVHGQVRSEGTGTPLGGAVVEVVSAGGAASHVTTDSAGVYVLKNVPLGRRQLRATHIDHAPLEVEIIVAPNTQMVLDFALELRPVKIAAVTAHAYSQSAMTGDTIAIGIVDVGQSALKAMEATPGVAELGVAQAVREVPGQQAPDPTDVLYVRGGTTDLKLVLLNGAPVYAPFHLGGLMNPLDGDLMLEARLFVGGAPARYDGGLSYVMDLETRSGRNTQSHATVALDMLSSRTVLEGPLLPGSTYLLAARSVHGLGARHLVADPFPYGYADGIGRIDFNLWGRSRLTAAGFWNQESVLMDSLSSGGSSESAKWGNTSGSLVFRGGILGADAELTAAAGRFETRLPVGGVRPIITDGLANRVRLAAHFAHAYGAVNAQFGVSYDKQHYQFNAWPQTSSRDSMLLRSNAEGDVTGFYVDAKSHPFHRVTLRTGLRADQFSTLKRPLIAPRVSATLLLTDKASVTVAAGRYRQFVKAPAGSGIVGTPVVDTVGRPALEIANASHVVVGFDQDIGEGVRVNLEGYYKAFDGLPSEEQSTASASGVDMWIRRGTGVVTGWVGYSLAWVWSSDTRAFAGRQLLSAGASGKLFRGGNFDIRLAYGAGLPFTAIPEPDATSPVFSWIGGSAVKPQNVPSTVPDDNFNYPVPPDAEYLRIDAQFSHTFIGDVRGFAFEVTPYFKVLNALDRRDALFYHFDRGQQEPQARPIAALPVLPVIGFEWRF